MQVLHIHILHKSFETCLKLHASNNLQANFPHLSFTYFGKEVKTPIAAPKPHYDLIQVHGAH